MKRLRLKLAWRDVLRLNFIEEVKSLQWKHQEIVVQLPLEQYDDSLLTNIEILPQLGRQVKSFKIHKCAINGNRHFRDIIACLPHLEVLEIISCPMIENHEREKVQSINPVTLRYLRKIIVDFSPWALLEPLRTPQLLSLKLNPTRAAYESATSISAFLEAASKLTSLEIDAEAFLVLFKGDLHEKMTFKLKVFRFDFYLRPNHSELYFIEENLHIFLGKQTLIEDMISNYVPRQTFEMMCSDMKNLTKLQIVLFTSYQSIHAPFMPEYVFEQLEFIHIETITGFASLVPFLREQPKLQTFSLKCEGARKQIGGIFNTLATKTNLKHLKFAGNFRTMKTVYKKAKVCSYKLSSLELTVIMEKKKEQYCNNYPYEDKEEQKHFSFRFLPGVMEPRCTFFE